MKVYIGLEVLLFVGMVICKLFFQAFVFMKCLNLLPILFTAGYVTLYRRRVGTSLKSLHLVLLLAVIGDLLFVVDEAIYGVYLFFLIQLCLLYYLNRTQLKPWYLIILAILIFVLCYVFNKNYLVVQGMLYIVLFLYNLWCLFKRSRYAKRELSLFLAFLFLSICDVQVFLIYQFQKQGAAVLYENICFIIEWFCYIRFQVFLTKYIMNCGAIKE